MKALRGGMGLSLLAVLLLACTSGIAPGNTTNLTFEVDGEVEGQPEEQRAPAAEMAENQTETPAESPLTTAAAAETVDLPTAPKYETHTVNMVDGGFEVNKITIKAGDTVVWQNVREGGMTQAMLIGVRNCGRIRSGVFHPGEFYKWQFTESGTCMVVDGIYTTQSMQVVVQ